jgi:hypothetical protein
MSAEPQILMCRSSTVCYNSRIASYHVYQFYRTIAAVKYISPHDTEHGIQHRAQDPHFADLPGRPCHHCHSAVYTVSVKLNVLI